MEPELEQELIDYLAQFVTGQRLQRIEEVLAWRTRYLTVLLEDVYQPHNASAALRSCEIFGVQDVHVVELENEFQPNLAIAMGAANWLTIKRYQDDDARAGLHEAAHTLREQGYHLVAMTLHEDSIPIGELSLEQPLALCFGTEEEGLTEEVHAIADSYVHLPMYGFTQSFNVSVTVALSLQALTHRLHDSDLTWRLSPQERQQLKLEWQVNSIPRGGIVMREYARSLGVSL